MPDCREFEGKRGDREVEKIFGVLERVSELRDCGLPQLVERASGGEAAKLVGALQVEIYSQQQPQIWFSSKLLSRFLCLWLSEFKGKQKLEKLKRLWQPAGWKCSLVAVFSNQITSI